MYRNAAAENAASGRTARNSRVDRTRIFANLPEFRLGAGPRAVFPGCPLPRPGVRVAALGTGSFALDDTPCHVEYLDTSVRPASGASAARLPGTPDCSSSTAAVPAETSARSLSASNVGSPAAGHVFHRNLDRPLRPAHSTVGPREPVTPHGSSLGEKLPLLPEALSTLRAITPQRHCRSAPGLASAYTRLRRHVNRVRRATTATACAQSGTAR